MYYSWCQIPGVQWWTRQSWLPFLSWLSLTSCSSTCISSPCTLFSPHCVTIIQEYSGPSRNRLSLYMLVPPSRTYYLIRNFSNAIPSMNCVLCPWPGYFFFLVLGLCLFFCYDTYYVYHSLFSVLWLPVKFCIHSLTCICWMNGKQSWGILEYSGDRIKRRLQAHIFGGKHLIWIVVVVAELEQVI